MYCSGCIYYAYSRRFDGFSGQCLLHGSTFVWLSHYMVCVCMVSTACSVVYWSLSIMASGHQVVAVHYNCFRPLV